MEFTPEFLRRLQRRDEQAFQTLYQQTVTRLARYLAGRYRLDRQTRDDLISDFFVKLRQRLHLLDVEQSFEARFWTMFRHFVIDFFKTNKQATSLDELGEQIDHHQPTPLAMAQQSHQLQQIYRVLDQLDDVSREIVVLRYVEDL